MPGCSSEIQHRASDENQVERETHNAAERWKHATCAYFSDMYLSDISSERSKKCIGTINTKFRTMVNLWMERKCNWEEVPSRVSCAGITSFLKLGGGYIGAHYVTINILSGISKLLHHIF